jgi:hypothetical protein
MDVRRHHRIKEFRLGDFGCVVGFDAGQVHRFCKIDL